MMDVEFVKNQITKDDPNYKWDVKKEFKESNEPNDWDEIEEIIEYSSDFGAGDTNSL
jgi:hypothetical protein